MRNIKLYLGILFIFSGINFLHAQQNDCGINGDFELGTTVGWVCKSGSYGSTVWSGFCPVNSPGTCPTFPTTISTVGILNANGINAPLNTFNDRHTIMTMAYSTGGTCPAGFDSVSHCTVPVVAPGGGNYSFRLGDGVAGGIGTNPNRLARAEAVRLTFNVNANNAGFTYEYALFLNDPGHLPQEQPRFEVAVYDSSNNIIPCGYYKYIAGSSNPYCNVGGSAVLDTGGSNGAWRYTNWSTVGLDLSGYIGQTVSIEFKTSDCFPEGTVAYSVAGVATTCSNGICSWSLPTPGTTTISSCTNAAGTHSAYVYIDAYCSPIYNNPFPYCTGDDSVRVDAPPGYQNWVWQTGNPKDTNESVWLIKPKPGDSIVVMMKSQAGCPTKAVFHLTGTDVFVRDTVFCYGTPGNVDLTATFSNPGTYTYTWTGPSTVGLPSGNLTTPIPIPTTTSTYTLEVDDLYNGCTYVKTMTVVILPQPCTVGIHEKNNADFFKAYPNPSSGKVELAFGDFLQNSTIRIYDLIGKEIYSETFSGNRITIDKKLQAGVYYLELRSGDKQFTQKIVIKE